MTGAKPISDYQITNDTRGVCCEDLAENSSRYSGTILYKLNKTWCGNIIMTLDVSPTTRKCADIVYFDGVSGVNHDQS